jgi:5'-3' exonuclease
LERTTGFSFYGKMKKLIIVMGVPSFFAWWVKHYQRLILLTRPDKTDLKRVLYLDFNGAIHPAVRTDQQMKLENMNEAVTTYLQRIVDYVQPDELFIAIDGVAPAAKMAQQRDRRYKSEKEAKEASSIAQRHGQTQRVEDVDFNMISPGTEFMYELQMVLEKYIDKGVTDGRLPPKVILSGSAVPGEGEHKIMAEIRQRKEDEEISLIYGLDADLIFLSLLNAPNAYLVRENVFFRGRDQSVFYDPDQYPFIYLSIGALRTIIVKTLDPRTGAAELTRMGFKCDDMNLVEGRTDWYKGEEDKLIRDYVYICFFMGNDFLPRLPSLRIRDGNLQDILVIYKKIAWVSEGFLVREDCKSLNRNFFNLFLKELAFVEDDFMLQQSSRRQKDIKNMQRRMREMDPAERDMERYRYVEDKYDDHIHGGTEGWRNRYYRQCLGYRWTHPKDHDRQLKTLCQDYIRGTIWVLQYYQGLHCNWSWLYPHHAAPTSYDLMYYSRFLKTYHNFVEDEPVSPCVQLMSILPPGSSHLVPTSLRPYMQDRNSSVHYMYPISFQVSLIGNKFLHECHAKMPHIDRDMLCRLVEANEKYFTPNEKTRNIKRGDVYQWE